MDGKPNPVEIRTVALLIAYNGRVDVRILRRLVREVRASTKRRESGAPAEPLGRVFGQEGDGRLVSQNVRKLRNAGLITTIGSGPGLVIDAAVPLDELAGWLDRVVTAKEQYKKDAAAAAASATNGQETTPEPDL